MYSVPFYGEDPCDLEMPRNCYLIADRGYNVLVHADSGPTNSGKSALKDGVIQSLVQKHGPIPLVFASQQQLLEVRGHAATRHCLILGNGSTWEKTAISRTRTSPTSVPRRRPNSSCRMPPAAQTGIRTISRSCSANGIPPAQPC